MRILIVTKRFSGSTGKDAILDDFCREVRLGAELAKKHKVTLMAADHVKKEHRTMQLHGMRVEIRPMTANLLGFIREIGKLAAANDIVMGTTHPLVAFCARLAARNKAFVYDVRDNYETYDLTNVFFLRNGFPAKNAIRLLNGFLIRKSDLVIFSGRRIKEKFRPICRKRIVVIRNGVEDMFRPMDKKKCRRELKLPNALIIAYVGNVCAEKGVDLLMAAFRLVRKHDPGAILLLSGKVARGLNIDRPGIMHKELPLRKDVPLAINAADVAVIPQPENAASRYAGFPLKLMEYMACNVPVVATATSDIPLVLPPESLSRPDAEDLAKKILSRPESVDYQKIVKQFTWKKLARELERELCALKNH